MSDKIIMQEHKMGQDAAIYHQGAWTYELFCRAEDAPGHVANYLSQELCGKDVLDVGCGTGRYLNLLAPFVRGYIGLDCSADQLAIARKKAEAEIHQNTVLIHRTAEQSGLPPQWVDACLATWVIESIRDPVAQERALAEMNRVLRRPGSVYVVENSGDSEFEDIIRREPDISTTKQTKSWLLNQGFEQMKTIESYFLFPSRDQARNVFSSIWGEGIANRITDRKINQTINIYRRIFP